MVECYQPKGSLWYFPAGQPHSIQATDDDDQGVEFLLVSVSSRSSPFWTKDRSCPQVFNDGNFSEDDTFLVNPLCWSYFTFTETINHL